MYTNMHQQNNCQSLTNRSYGFKELAVLYFPNIAPASNTSVDNIRDLREQVAFTPAESLPSRLLFWKLRMNAVRWCAH
jgi:DNA polymerase III gamma/tau subunit